MPAPKSEDRASKRAMPSKSKSAPERRKRFALVTSLILLLLSGYLSWRQPTPGQLDPPARFPHLKWFRYPLEVNPENRPPTYPVNWRRYPFVVKPQDRPPFARTGLRAITIIPETGGRSLIAVGGKGTILRSNDDGAVWEPQHNPAKPSLDIEPVAALDAVTFSDATNGWVVGYTLPDVQDYILHTTDGGATWHRQEIALTESGSGLLGVAFTNAGTGWASGADGTIWHTTDGGSTWTPYIVEHRRAVTNLRFIDGHTGWAVGRLGLVLHTTDGGATWFQENSGTSATLFDVFFTNPYTGWTVGENGSIFRTSDGGRTWRPQASGTTNTLANIQFTNDSSGWVVGRRGTILHTTDGGESWVLQPNGTKANLLGVAFADDQTGWAVGQGGTILHTTNGGANWIPQEGFRYRKYPAPWFYIAASLLLPVFIWALIPISTPSTRIQDSVTADSPVESLEDDKLGQRPLVERLSGFLQNPNTLPPLVISLQAPWGMGKSTVMRMLQSNLERNRAAVTVWFNAWHHQKEDQLLAYLLETVQKEAVPQWLSRNGIPFRVNLVRVRLFGWKHVDRLALVLGGIALVFLQRLHPEWLPGSLGHSRWLLYASPFVAALPILDALVAFKSNPDKLVDKAGGFLVDTFKELVRLPSLIGKSDVRQEFADNLRDVVAALRPQRLVIFLDDLDRCKPEQVVQILEAINFLSSVAQCFLIVGADYEKVETLVANQFEPIALREAENRAYSTTGLDVVGLRVQYARNYLRKIVNLRLNLHRPIDYVSLLADVPRSSNRRGTLGPIAGVFATGAVLAAVIWSASLVRQNPKPTVSAPSQSIGILPANSLAPSQNPTAATAAAAESKPGTDPDTLVVVQFPEDGGALRNVLSIGIPLALAVGALFYWFNRPRTIEEAKDARTFTAALEEYSNQIFLKYESPREARRFLNYLRLVATTSGQGERDTLKNLREMYPSQFDRGLVSLAAAGADSQGTPSAVKQYYSEQCELFGLDEKTFLPKENGVLQKQPEAR